MALVEATRETTEETRARLMARHEQESKPVSNFSHHYLFQTKLAGAKDKSWSVQFFYHDKPSQVFDGRNWKGA